jgi:hypothetical protein
VLHGESFRDDATRTFRALRYAARPGSRSNRAHGRIDRDGISYIKTIGGERLRRELELLLGEETGGAHSKHAMRRVRCAASIRCCNGHTPRLRPTGATIRAHLVDPRSPLHRDGEGAEG